MMTQQWTNIYTCAGAVLYAANVLGARGPRRMQVYLPRVVQRDGSVAPWRSPEEMYVSPFTIDPCLFICVFD